MVSLVALVVSAGCSTPTFSVPRVDGLRLDDAHNKLKDAGFEEFTDVDAISDRSPLVDANWVVVSQSPTPDQSVEKDMTIGLRIAKPEDEGIREMLPADSPVLAEILAADRERDRQAAEDARELEQQRQADAAAAVAAAKDYAEALDPGLRLGQSSLAEIVNLQNNAASGSLSGVELDLTIDAAFGLIDSFQGFVAGVETPDARQGARDALNDALDGFRRVCQTLLSADGVGAAAATERSGTLLSENRTKYNQAVTDIYAGTGLQAPLMG